MDEANWLDELLTVCSLPSIDILKFLWSQNDAVDTHSIAKGTHMSMEEVYGHLKSLESQGIVKMKRNKDKNGDDRRVWIPNLNKFSILIKAENGNFSYRSNIKKKSLKITDMIEENRPTKKLSSKTDEETGTVIKIKHKDTDVELKGPETFVEKHWNELKKYVGKTPEKKKQNKKKPSKSNRKAKST